MDQIEKDSGLDEENFWHKSKLELIDILLSKIEKKNLKILVIGCGVGNDLVAIKKYAKKLVVIDVNKKALNNITLDLVKKKMNASSMSFKNESFDVILSFDVFEHIKNDKRAFDECRRVLKKEGFLIMTVPAYSALYSSYDVMLKHYRRYDFLDLSNKTKSLRVVYKSYWNCILFLPFCVDRLFKKFKKHKAYGTINPILNRLLFRLMNFENFLIKKGLRLPFGMTLCLILQPKLK
ncbi:MAG: class I SAM-dependent methyltransferase [Nanoarchaeota archaeon]|nr:class I SAM-dependent methyltransferase [Nanoarchaeota archaeon]